MKRNELEDLQQVELAVSRGGQTLRLSLYYLDGLLIDTGPARKQTFLHELFQEWPIEQVVITHHHEDHTGLAHWLQEKKQVPIYMHTLGVSYCQTKAKLPLYRHLFWGARQAFQALPIDARFTTENYTWEVIDTPGHAADHIALYNREKGWLFGGDLYVTPTPKSMFKFESAPKQIESLQKVLTYD